MRRLSEAERAALDMAKRATLISHVPTKTEIDAAGGVTPGILVIRRLEREGLLFVTEEEPIDLGDGNQIEITPTIELTVEGMKIWTDTNKMHT